MKSEISTKLVREQRKGINKMTEAVVIITTFYSSNDEVIDMFGRAFEKISEAEEYFDATDRYMNEHKLRHEMTLFTSFEGFLSEYKSVLKEKMKDE